ncbi:MAG: flagellar filament capping protein FliD, partial [bacterium]
MSVSFSGFNSGLNTDRIISKLLAVERRPIRRYRQDISENENVQDKFKTLNSKTGTLQDASNVLTELNTFKQKKASSSNTDVFTASIADPDVAEPGTYDVSVNQLATKAEVTSGTFINDQMMATTDGETSLSDFEQVEGSGTLDTSTDFLDDLSKSVDTNGAGNVDIRIRQEDDTGAGTHNVIEIDLDTLQDNGKTFDDLMNAINNFDDSMAGVTTTANGLSPGDWAVEMNYDESRDKFSILNTDDTEDANSPDAVKLQDNPDSINTSNFFQKIGMNSDDGTEHIYDQRQSDFGENLVSIDPSKTFSTDSLFTSKLGQSDGTIKINNTTIDWDKDTSTDAASNINELVTKIDDNVEGVTANYNSSTDKITLKTENTGQGTIDVEDTDGELANVLNLRESGNETNSQTAQVEDAGTDSEIVFDGDTISDSDNTVTVDGIQLDLKDTGSGEEVTVEDDKEAITKDVNSFVEKFNEVIKFINSNSKEQAPDSPDDSSQNKSGVFVGDLTTQTISNRITDIVTKRYDDAVTAGNEIESLSDVGIELVDPITSSNKNTGTLKFDKSEFKDALENNTKQVRQLFTAVKGDSDKGGNQDGAGVQLDKYLEDVTGSSGVISGRIDGIDERINNLNDRIERQKDRVERKKTRLERKFLQMEKVLGRLQQQR